MEKEREKETNQDEQPKRQVCSVCHGMGVKELPSGDTIDCPVRSCENGYVKIR